MIKIGIVGTGGMAHAHAEAYSKIKGVKVTACCDICPDRRQSFAEKWRIPRTYSDYRQMLEKEGLNGISNVTIDSAHAVVSLAAIARNIPVLCEKPLATTLTDARKMAEAARRKKVIAMVNFSYRNSCGLQAAASLIHKGTIGRILHVEASYLQSWLSTKIWGDWRTSPALLWRLSQKHGSAGVLGDIGCHIYDMTTFLCGDISQIFCTLKTFDKGVPENRLGDYTLDANDSLVANVVFKNGAIGTIHSSRWATGHANSLRVRVYGDRGAVEVDLDRGYDSYKVCLANRCVKGTPWNLVKCKPTPTNYQRFIRAIKTGTPDPSNFENGLKVQAYLHCSLKSDSTKTPVRVTF